MVGADKTHFHRCVGFRWFVFALLTSGRLAMDAAETRPVAGLRLSFHAQEHAIALVDSEIVPNLALYVPQGELFSPFSPAGPFVAEWTGYLTVPFRDDFRFRAMTSGKFFMELNGERVLELEGSQDWSEASEETRLRKGSNTLQIVFQSSRTEDAVLRVEWSSPDFLFEPISPEQLQCDVDDEVRRFDELRAGRTLFLNYRCAHCHAKPSGETSTALSAAAPDLSGIGSRRHVEWLRKWILNPRALREDARMPVVFRGDGALAQIGAVVAYLSSLKEEGEGEDFSSSVPHGGDAKAGGLIFEKLHCGRCHYLDSSNSDDRERLFLGGVSRKFSFRSLVRFLKNPGEHYPRTRMPQFGFSDAEAIDLAEHLFQGKQRRLIVSEIRNEALVDSGRRLLVRHGCVRCHGVTSPDEAGIALGVVSISDVGGGCLADEIPVASPAPDYRLSPDERRVLRAFSGQALAALDRRVAREAAHRYQRQLRCAACHGEVERGPALDLLGAKLKPEWMHDFLAGDVEGKPRPWLEARMPAFPAYAKELTVGMSHAHGYAGKTPAGRAIDREAADLGRQMVSPVDGFSCVSCHGVGQLKPTEVFESEGINLVYSGARLQKEYYWHWLLKPLRIDETTKMPVYFDEEGNSPLYDVYDGDTEKQLNAIWEYLRLGSEMIPPPLE
ncbi:MAG: hypothetical protein M2R45_03794 [Verrucomicrobia subdivision 3 bacterium]|nr:hypothetical protein [Limisphaerales bacterium]MCS1416765.1 hypothetical protein [Limisphaerales bacterium]